MWALNYGLNIVLRLVGGDSRKTWNPGKRIATLIVFMRFKYYEDGYLPKAVGPDIESGLEITAECASVDNMHLV